MGACSEAGPAQEGKAAAAPKARHLRPQEQILVLRPGERLKGRRGSGHKDISLGADASAYAEQNEMLGGGRWVTSELQKLCCPCEVTAWTWCPGCLPVPRKEGACCPLPATIPLLLSLLWILPSATWSSS